MDCKNLNLTISVVLYNTPVQHLEALFASLSYVEANYKLYFIDNSPVDYLSQYLIGRHGVVYVHRPDNPGYGAGHNAAIHASMEDGSIYHLILNADISFDSDIVSQMISYMDDNEEVGQMMPKILNSDGSIQYLCKLCPSPFDLFLRRFVPDKFSRKNLEKFTLRKTGYDKIMFVPYLSGCFMFLRRAALKDVGLFDERFFMYPEDIDITRRIAMKYDTIFYPLVSVRHEYGGASKKSLKMFVAHSYNLIKYFNKWGWFIDNERKYLNLKTLRLLRSAGLDV